VTAWSGSGKNILADIGTADGHMAFFDERSERNASAMVLRFPVSMSGRKARLILHGYNTGWAGYLNHEFQGYFGRYYPTWRTHQEEKGRKKIEQWLLNQSLPIKVHTRQPNGSWKMADYIPLAGNTAMRKFILELDLPPGSTSTVDIKLETVYNFWQIDYAALDFSEQSDIRAEWISPDITQTSDQAIEAAKLAQIDEQYLVLQDSEALNLAFTLPPNNAGHQTFFLVGTGYYHQPAITEAGPDIRKLFAFRKPGAFQSLSLNETRKMESGMIAHLKNRGH
jgi:hypothetical protein